MANAYDAMMLTALAIQNAGSTDGPKVRDGFYKIGSYDGLIKTYNKPFTPDNHDAVNENDYVWTQFIDNQILPVGHEEVRSLCPDRRRPPRAAFLFMLVTSALITGLGLGSMYGLLALGFYVTYAVSSTVNFAQGSSMMLGAVFAYTFAVTLRLAVPAARRCSRSRCARSTACWSRWWRCGPSCAAARTPG